MKVNAISQIRKMRGGSQAHLLECDDGHFYVVKFQNNPQHRRILVNEWIASSLLAYLRISTPEIALVNISAEFLADNPQVYIELRTERVPVDPGQHFGSRYPGNRSKDMIFDFIPDILLEKVVNRNEFLGAVVLDKWTGNVDKRQAIFRRSRIRPCNGSETPRGYLASMIDQGYAFAGPQWTFVDSPLYGLYFRTSVYHNVKSWDDFQPWLDRVVRFPEGVLDQAQSQIPSEWIRGEEALLDSLLKKLLSRCKRVPDLIEDMLRADVNPFPEWRGGHQRPANVRHRVCGPAPNARQ